MNRTEPRTPGPRTPGTLPPVTLSPEEAAAVAAALATRPDGEFGEAARVALEKVLTVLEPDPDRRARLLTGTRRLAAEAARDAGLRSRLERGVTGRRVLVLDYRDRQDRWSERAVEPQVLVSTGTHRFLVAWCRERQALRWFREDRIGGAELTDEAAPRRQLPGLGTPPAAAHPAGRRPARTPVAPEPPRLRLLPGGRA